MRREWSTGIIKDLHVAPSGTYGYRRVPSELTQSHGVSVSANLVNLLMHNAAITGLPGPGRASSNSGVPTDDDLVNRSLNRDGLNELRVSDITEHKAPWISAIAATLAGGCDGWLVVQQGMEGTVIYTCGQRWHSSWAREINWGRRGCSVHVAA
jgi:hypothetical protein